MESQPGVNEAGFTPGSPPPSPAHLSLTPLLSLSAEVGFPFLSPSPAAELLKVWFALLPSWRGAAAEQLSLGCVGSRVRSHGSP